MIETLMQATEAGDRIARLALADYMEEEDDLTAGAMRACGMRFSRLPSGLYMGAYPVTQEQYKEVMGKNPSWFSAGGGGKDKVSGSTSKHPVETVSWIDAKKFCAKLSALAGGECRLPTEAEWEYACRAGTTTKYCSGDEEDDLKKVAWYRENSGGRTHEVGMKIANVWGLYDMHGNVWEWCNDVWEDKQRPDPTACFAAAAGSTATPGFATRPTAATSRPSTATTTLASASCGLLDNVSSRVVRGGSWLSDGQNCRSAYRGRNSPAIRNFNLGFRVACCA